MSNPYQPGRQVVELRQFHLQFSFMTAGPQGEDVEDERDPINDSPADGSREVALLGSTQLVVEDDELGPVSQACRGNLLHLSATRKKGGVGRSRRPMTTCTTFAPADSAKA